ncbi:hypothetical protein EMIT0324P_30604 [Pseudomonas chlororaphis]
MLAAWVHRSVANTFKARRTHWRDAKKARQYTAPRGQAHAPAVKPKSHARMRQSGIPPGMTVGAARGGMALGGDKNGIVIFWRHH